MYTSNYVFDEKKRIIICGFFTMLSIPLSIWLYTNEFYGPVILTFDIFREFMKTSWEFLLYIPVLLFSFGYAIYRSIKVFQEKGVYYSIEYKVQKYANIAFAVFTIGAMLAYYLLNSPFAPVMTFVGVIGITHFVSNLIVLEILKIRMPAE